ncbi:uncharacterized protein BKA78DRAFT_312417 [Phyllosticta capitalensis]|uniref:uncharacterized protein n=1 Tax=Phyllosticta capitalensis TaxID=121624 RepID=UPI00312F203A
MFLFFPFDHKRGLRNQASGSAVAAKQATTLKRSVIQTAKRSKMRSSSTRILSRSHFALSAAAASI